MGFVLGMITGAGLTFLILAALGEIEWETTYTVEADKSDSEDHQ